MGNASNLRNNSTWSTILDEMEKEGQIGFGFPIVCSRHPEQVNIISEPGQLSKVAPLGTGRNYATGASLTSRQVVAYFPAGSSSPADIIADPQ